MASTQIAQYQGTGKRKTSVARVILRPGDGTTWFNGRTIEEYFPRAVHRQTALAPLKVAELEGRYDIRVRVHGGGPSGQAGAVGTVSRARSSTSIPSCAFLKRAGFLTATHALWSARRPVCTKRAKRPSSPAV
jgi:small subunit ribosomal protein S9